MNNARRKQIDRLIRDLNEIETKVQSLGEEEEAALDNLPESLQDTDRAGAMQEAVDALENACDSINEALEYLEEAKGE